MNIKQSITILILLISLTKFSYSQTERRTFVGLQPAITVEPFYDEGELDVNVFPFVYECRIGHRINIRFAPIVNYHLGGSKNGFSDLSLFTVMPVFLKKAESLDDKTYGFYMGPVLGFGRNILNNHYTTTLAMEPGYMFEAKKSFSITLGLQLGGSYFHYDEKPNKWVFHWGPKVTFGFWLINN